MTVTGVVLRKSSGFSTVKRGVVKSPNWARKEGLDCIGHAGKSMPTRGVPAPHCEEELGRVEGARDRGI
jgi:hypothetical protein